MKDLFEGLILAAVTFILIFGMYSFFKRKLDEE